MKTTYKIYNITTDYTEGLLIELVTEEDGETTVELMTVREYLRKEVNAIQTITEMDTEELTSFLVALGLPVSGNAIELPTTTEQANNTVHTIRTVLTTLVATEWGIM